ncbi:hypothetical protein SLEP1_g28876 [Rubroshorea leprosula]|uniref:Uncharacterized protein n=1 Tax=Rubroshorea leprosula TaxID=152421 RepID=A0AAV5JXN4_9ROSI|nr:hypothetical protein SLEP1_g28876 [Rubroshorea leprosula]
MRSTIAMPLFCLDLRYPSNSHWRLIGFFGRKPKEKDEVGEVATGENATSVSKGAIVPLLKFGNKGLQRIGIVRACPIFALTAIVATIFSHRWPSSLNCPYMSWAQFKSVTNACSKQRGSPAQAASREGVQQVKREFGTGNKRKDRVQQSAG